MTGTAKLIRKYGREHPTLRNMDSCIVRRTLADSVRAACEAWAAEIPGGLVLDVGCGAQPYRPWIEEAGLRYAGVDWPQSIHRTPAGRTLLCDLSTFPWPLEPESADAILCSEVLEHQPEALPFLRECRRVLRTGGSALFTAPFVWPEHESPHDYFRYTRHSFQRLLTEAGFEIVWLRKRGGWHLALAQFLGLWSCQAFRKPLNYLTRAAAWPIMVVLVLLERCGESDAPLPMTLGYSVFVCKTR